MRGNDWFIKLSIWKGIESRRRLGGDRVMLADGNRCRVVQSESWLLDMSMTGILAL